MSDTFDRKQLEDFIDVDKYNLDEECELQTKRYAYYSLEFARISDEVDKLDLEINILYAELDGIIRQNDVNKNDPKLQKKEAEIKNEILRNKIYHEKKSKLLSLKAEAKRWEVGVKTLSVRKKQIENLLTLYTTNYYSDPHYDTGYRKDIAKQKQIVLLKESGKK